jgi:leucyl-tRNA synthetase
MRKWLDRVYRLFTNNEIKITKNLNEIKPDLNVAYHKFIKQVEHEMQHLNFNVAISQMMIYINACYAHDTLLFTHLENFLIVLSCFAPHLSEELWHQALKRQDFVNQQQWPKYDEQFTVDQQLTLPIQINGKLRATISITRSMNEKTIINLALNESKINSLLKGQTIKKTIYIKEKILNLIV